MTEIEEEAKKLVLSGYCPVSNRYKSLSRIDVRCWKTIMSKSHPGRMGWVDALGDVNASEHYRRVFSKDIISVCDDVYIMVKKMNIKPIDFLEKVI